MKNKHFSQRLTNFGIRRILKSLDFIISLLILLFLLLTSSNTLLKINKEFVDTSIHIAVSLAALIIAAFSILVSFSNREFVTFLKELKIYDKILFLFEWNIYVAIITVMVGVLINYFIASSLIYVIYIFLFVYMICSILSLVSFITYFGLRKGEFEEINKPKEKFQNPDD